MKKKFIRSIISILILIQLPVNIYSQWSNLTPPASDLYSLSFYNKDTGAIITQSGQLYLTQNNAQSWQLSYSNVSSVVFINSQIILISEYLGTIYKSIDGGQNWIPKYSVPNDILLSKADNGSIVGTTINSGGDSTLIYYSLTQGETWQYQCTVPGFVLANRLIDENNYFLVTSGIYKTIDGGQSFQLKFDPLSVGGNAIYSIKNLNSDTLFACGYYYVYKSYNGGENWTVSSPYVATIYYDLAKKGNEMYCVGGPGVGSGDMMKTEDAGINWVIPYFPSETLFSISFPDTSNGFSCGSGLLLEYNNPNEVSEKLHNSDFEIFPNPVNEILNLKELNSTQISIQKLEISDILGKKIELNISFKQQNAIDISQYASGIYTINIYTSSGVISKKFIKQ